MEIDLLNSGRFFPWPGEPEGSDVGVVLRLPNRRVILEFDAATVTQGEYRVVNGQLYRERIVDEILREELRIDYSIVSWNGLKDEKGNDLPCNRENKIKAMYHDLKFQSFVNFHLLELQDGIGKWITGEPSLSIPLKE